MASGIPWSKIKLLSFDIYGTLLDWENGHAKDARDSAIGPYLPGSHRDLLMAIYKHDVAVQTEFPTMKQSDVIAEGLRRYAAELKVVENGHLSQEQVDSTCKEYGKKIHTYQAFPDTVEAMQRLGKYYKLVPLTNIDHQSYDKALDTTLKGIPFTASYIAEDIGSYKPDLKNFHYLLDHIKQDYGVEKDELLHVAQSLFHDHRPAKEMDIRSVWVDRHGVMGGELSSTGEDFGYQLRVESLAELADIVEKARP